MYGDQSGEFVFGSWGLKGQRKNSEQSEPTAGFYNTVFANQNCF